MYTRTTTVINASGLHARPASEFVRAAAKFDSKISIKKAGAEKEANAKSILFLLSLGLTQGTEVELMADGSDEQKAIDTLVDLIESGFDE